MPSNDTTASQPQHVCSNAELGRLLGIHDYRQCHVENCEACQELVDHGFVMACDECGFPGSTDSDGWTQMPDGRMLCNSCLECEPNDRRKDVRV